MDPDNMIKQLSALLLAATPLLSQASDIMVADIHNNQGVITLSKSKNITARKGYDNQPMFNTNGSGLFYTAMFEQGDKSQTDSMFYSFSTGETSNITNTPNYSEYSPTPIDNDSALSMIFVDETGSQKLWQTNIKTGQQTPINLSIEPVGYHAWGKNGELLLFVLGEEMMLQYATQANQKQAEVITKNIGRSLRYNKQRDIFTFSKSASKDDEKQVLHQFDAKTKQIKRLIPLPNQSQYYTWLNADTLLSANGNQLMAWKFSTNNTSNASEWQLLADLSKECPTSITRLAVANDQSKLAYVCEEQ